MNLLYVACEIFLSYSWIALFINSFLSATILPLSSEVLFLALLAKNNESILFLWFIATLGNSLGGITNLALGRFFPKRFTDDSHSKSFATAEKWIKQYGAYTLLLSWVPIIGDALCIIAGWQRLNIKTCILYLTLGKGLRYLVLTLPYIALT